MEVAVAQLFGGRDESINVLTTLISNGNLLGGGQQNSSFRPSLTAPNQTQTALAEMAAKIFYAYAIPSAWNVTGQAAFVVDTGLPCDAVNPAADNLNNDVRDTTATCYYEHLYFIASPLGAARDCDGASDTAVVCRDNLFSAPPGVGALDGVAFEGVRVSDIVIGYVSPPQFDPRLFFQDVRRVEANAKNRVRARIDPCSRTSKTAERTGAPWRTSATRPRSTRSRRPTLQRPASCGCLSAVPTWPGGRGPRLRAPFSRIQTTHVSRCRVEWSPGARCVARHWGTNRWAAGPRPWLGVRPVIATNVGSSRVAER